MVKIVLYAFAIVVMLAPLSDAQDQAVVTPLRLREAIAEALRNSPRLRPSVDQVESAAIQRRLASSQFQPKLTPQLLGGTDPTVPGQQTLGLGVSERLMTGTEVQV